MRKPLTRACTQTREKDTVPLDDVCHRIDGMEPCYRAQLVHNIWPRIERDGDGEGRHGCAAIGIDEKETVLHNQGLGYLI